MLLMALCGLAPEAIIFSGRDGALENVLQSYSY